MASDSDTATVDGSASATNVVPKATPAAKSRGYMVGPPRHPQAVSTAVSSVVNHEAGDGVLRVHLACGHWLSIPNGKWTPNVNDLVPCRRCNRGETVRIRK